MTVSASTPPRRTGAGRPRDESKTPQILAAVRAVIAESGYQQLRVEAVAERAAVSPGSVYRRWPTKAELVVAALDSSPDPFPMAGTGDADSDFVTMLTDLARALSEPGHSRLALLAADPNEPDVAAAARRHIPRVRRYLRRLLADQVGQDHPAMDLLVDIGPALVWYRALVAGEQVDAPALVGELTTHVFDRVGRRPVRQVDAAAPAEQPDGASSGGRKDARRNRRSILAAAGELFAEHTFTEVQLDDVASRAGVSRATLVRHVGTKQQLLLEVYKERVRDMITLADGAMAEPDPWLGVEQLFRTAAFWAAHDSGLHRYIRGDGPDVDDEEWHALVARLTGALDGVLDRAREAGVLQPGITAADVYPLVSFAVTAAEVPGADTRRYTDILLRGLARDGGDG